MNMKKYLKMKSLNYIEHLLILNSTVSGFISIFDFASLVTILIEITSSAIGLKIFIITTVQEKYRK